MRAQSQTRGIADSEFRDQRFQGKQEIKQIALNQNNTGPNSNHISENINRKKIIINEFRVLDLHKMQMFVSIEETKKIGFTASPDLENANK